MRQWIMAALCAAGCGQVIAAPPAGDDDDDTDDGSDDPDAAPDDCEVRTWYADRDGDGHGDPQTSVESCDELEGFVEVGDDCDDEDPARAPGRDEACDGIDNDCAPETEEDCPYGCEIRLRGDQRRPYVFCPVLADHDGARDGCEQAGFGLVEITDFEENAWLRDMFQEIFGTGGAVHIGGTDREVEGEYVWDSGEPFDYEAWSSGEPNDGYGDGEDCVTLNWDGGWNDIVCEAGLYFICEPL
jgi:hypothetical protein